MKKFSIISLSLIVLTLFAASSVITSSVSAQGGPKPKNTPGAKATEKAGAHELAAAGTREHFKGTITLVDAASMTLTLKDGSTVSMAIAPATTVKAKRAGRPTGTETLQPGMQVNVQAVRGEDGSLTALRIQAIPGKPSKIHRVGTVTDYQPGVSITVADKDGQATSFALTADTKILPQERADQLAVGSRVTIINPRDPQGGTVAAQGIVIHPDGTGDGQETEPSGS